MPILIDISQIVVANCAAAPFKAKHDKVPVDDFFVKHMILNSLRLYNKQFKSKYGEMIICCDSKNTWRKDAFTFYKSKRAKAKQDSPIDWNMVHRTLDTMISDLDKYFPYRVIKIEGCEGDDIIGTLARYSTEPTIIISADGDFVQLQSNTKVKQFNPIKKEFIECVNPALYLKEQIIRGDDGDGVPNILSDDDALHADGKRQASVFAAKVAVWVNQDPKMFCESAKVLKNYERNTMLIDLERTPEELQEKILLQSRNQANGTKQSITEYFQAHRMRNLLEVLNEF